MAARQKELYRLSLPRTRPAPAPGDGGLGRQVGSREAATAEALTQRLCLAKALCAGSMASAGGPGWQLSLNGQPIL